MKEEKEREFDLDCRNVDLSIIVPVYNMEKYLKRCLDSIVEAIKQFDGSVEVLLVNDGSQDSSLEILELYSRKNHYMQVINKVNGGLSDAKNTGLANSVGEYVIFLDSDDYIEPDMYCEMMSAARKENADIVVCDIELIYEDKSGVVHPCNVVSRNGSFAQVIDINMMPASWNKMVRRELYFGLDFPIGKNNEDIAVTPIVLAKANKIVIVNRPFYKYFQRKGSIQNSSFSEKRFVVLETSKLCMNRIIEHKIDEKKAEQIKGSVYLHQVLSLAMYLIRREKIINRYLMLKKYIKQVEILFPDLYNNFEIKEYVTWDTKLVQLYRKCAIFLLRNKQAFLLAIYFTPFNLYLRIRGSNE